MLGSHFALLAFSLPSFVSVSACWASRSATRARCSYGSWRGFHAEGNDGLSFKTVFSGFLSAPARGRVLDKPTNTVSPPGISLLQHVIILGLLWHLKVGEGTSR